MKRQESKVTCKGLFYQTQSDEPVTELEEALRSYLLCPTLIFTYTHTHMCTSTHVFTHTYASRRRLYQLDYCLSSGFQRFHFSTQIELWAQPKALSEDEASFRCSCGSRDAWKTCEWGILPQTEVSAWTLCTLRLRSIHIRDSHWPLSL